MDIRGDEIQPMEIPRTFLLTYLLQLTNFAKVTSVENGNETFTLYVCTGIIVYSLYDMPFIDVDICVAYLMEEGQCEGL